MTGVLPRKLSAQVSRPDAAPVGLAASWYVGLRSDQLGRRPVPVRLFGRDLVAWRDRSGRPVLAGRFCPHQGASLALGTVVDGSLRCPFHGWRFDGSGTCVRIPGTDRIPSTARLATYPVQERYGFVWVWYGTPTPLFPLPDFPPRDADRHRYIGFRYADRTVGTARQLLENAFDYFHFEALHGLSLDRTEFRMLRDQSEAADNGAPIQTDAWLGSWFEGVATPGHPIHDPFRWLVAKSATFAAGDSFQVMVDGWPGGQRFTGYVDGKVFYKVLMAIVPIEERRTTQVGWMVTPRGAGIGPRTVFNLFTLFGQYRGGSTQDLPVYNNTEPAAGTLRAWHDNGLLRFRKYYQSWVDRVDPAYVGARS
jgi:nitrite reductase/ring-hydroxylating ferredoxin subunit